ncbi:hypothetical protein [Luteolibacter luteus]|uniref:Uncharacterized protein n=1 Tax=Luteolibacter luteus TaxID=2728835 RepID=A0A858RRW4_9BACT|nr:hypothetical protein [Luteolibacter luteus]QJE98683.1 hypothetical protein HHL09_23830 [Luteolibacter luteus]
MKQLLFALAACHGLVTASAAALPEGPPAISVAIKESLGAKPDILVAVWPDGSILWSKDREDGGPPYLSGKTDPAKVTAFLTKLDKEGVFKKGPDDLVYVGPDASYHEIDLLRGNHYVYLQSWHELYERNPKTVGTSHGLAIIGEGETREQILAKETAEYRAYRQLWKEIRDFTTSLIPPQGAPAEAPPKFKYPEE